MTVFNGAAVRRQLVALGVLRVAHFAAFYMSRPDAFLPFNSVADPRTLAENRDDILAAFDLWADESSRVEYLMQLRWHLDLATEERPPPFPSRTPISKPTCRQKKLSNEVFVDCGSADGDTIEELYSRGKNSESVFSRLLAIEPDPGIIEKLQARLKRLPTEVGARVHILRYALGRKKTTLRFRAGELLRIDVGLPPLFERDALAGTVAP